MGRKDFKKETMAKRARSRVMDDKMSKMMMSPRKMMSMGKSPGPGMGADSAPMPFKKGGMAKKYASGGMVGASNADKPKRLSTTTGITAEQYQQAKAQNTDIGQMSSEQRAQRRATMGAQRDQARQQKMDRFKTFATNRPTAAAVPPGIKNPSILKAREAAEMRKVQTEIRQAKRAGVDVQSPQAMRNAQRAPGTQTQPGPMPAAQAPGANGTGLPPQKTAAFKKGGAVKKYAVGGLVVSNEMTPGMVAQEQMRAGLQRQPGPQQGMSLPPAQQNMPKPMRMSQAQMQGGPGMQPYGMQGGPGLQRQPGPMPMQGGPGRQRQPGPMPMQQNADQLRQKMDMRKAEMRQGQPAPRGGMSPQQQSAQRLGAPQGGGGGLGAMSPSQMSQFAKQQSVPDSQPSAASGAYAQQLMQQGKMQQAGTPGMGGQSGFDATTRLPAFKKGGMVKKPASKNPMPMGPKGGKAGMMLIIGFGKKGKK